MGSHVKIKPLIRSQKQRAIEKACSLLCGELNRRRDDLFLIYSVRLSQLVKLSESIIPELNERIKIGNTEIDAAIYLKTKDGQVVGAPILCILFDKRPEDYPALAESIERISLPLVWTSEQQLLRDEDDPENSLVPARDWLKRSASMQGPFNIGETRFLTILSQLINERALGGKLLLTGQAALASITDFEGFSHNQYQSPTDVDLLLCTAPPVCIPVLGIEIDGPTHFSSECWRRKGKPQRLEQELRKNEEKNRAFADAEIPAFRIRVDRTLEDLLRDNVSLISGILAKAIEEISYGTFIYQKKLTYLRNISERFKDDVAQIYSTSPYLEDSIQLAPEIIDWLIHAYALCEEERRELALERDSRLRDQAQGLSPSESNYPYWEQEKLDRLTEACAEDLFAFLDVEIEDVEEISDGAAKRIHAFVFAKVGSDSEQPLFTCEKIVPWMEFSGHEKNAFNKLMLEVIAKHIGRSEFGNKRNEEKQRFKERVQNWLTEVINNIETENEIHGLQRGYQTSGVIHLFRYMEPRLRLFVRQKLEERGYIKAQSRKVGGKTHDMILSRWNWIHSEVERPRDWDINGEPNPSFELLISVFPILDPLTQKSIAQGIKSRLNRGQALFCKLPVQPDDAKLIEERALWISEMLTPPDPQ